MKKFKFIFTTYTDCDVQDTVEVSNTIMSISEYSARKQFQQNMHGEAYHIISVTELTKEKA